MYMMSKDPSFIKIYGSLINKIPKSIQECLSITTKDLYATIIMEYCDFNLRKYMKTKDHVEREKLALEFGKILIEAMTRLNNKGIKHKDLKPKNILVQLNNRKPSIKIVDFDVSSVYTKLIQKSLSSYTNVAGTFEYLAPELRHIFELNLKGKQFFNSNKADVYSLGITLFKVAVMPQGQEKIELNIDSNHQDLQSKVNGLIEDKIQNEELKKLLSLLLVVDPKRRKSFRDFSWDNEVDYVESQEILLQDSEDEEIYFGLDG